MLISVLNKFTNHWEIKNYNTMLDTEKWEADMNKAGQLTALEIRKGVPRETIKEQDENTQIDYEQLRAEAVPNFFTTAFLTASKTIPLYCIVLDLLRSGQSPYEVIEWLTEQMHERDKLIANYSKKDQYY